jgi:cell wall-associated NlpC family hydrolase
MSVAAPSRLDSPRLPTRTARARLAARLCAAALGAATLVACTTAPQQPAVPPYVDPVGLFPLNPDDLQVDHWIDPASPGYDTPFLSAADQQRQYAELVARYFGTGAHDPSPWNPAYVDQRVYGSAGEDIVDLQQRRIERFTNAGKPARETGYGQNFRPHTQAWIDAIAHNMDVAQFGRDPHYRPARRAIATGNVLIRELPTMDPSFYSHRLAGEGYPFDNLQISAARPGTPLYVLGSSVDGAWDYVQTPDVQGWVASGKVGLVSDAFVERWRSAARAQLAAVIAASAPVRDSDGVFRFAAPAGTLLPVAPGSSAAQLDVMVPARDVDGHAIARIAPLAAGDAVPAPWSATPRHLATLMKNLIGRPYGWGNTGFYNDCSSELQSIFATFGVWLPRHSSTQMSAGAMTDLSDASPPERLAYLVRHGVPMRTLIYIGGHVMLYLGTTTYDHRVVPLVYQDVWGLRPADNSRRAVIGGSVIMPLLATVPEDPSLISLAATPVFRISILGSPAAGPATPPDDDNPAS